VKNLAGGSGGQDVWGYRGCYPEAQETRRQKQIKTEVPEEKKGKKKKKERPSRGLEKIGEEEGEVVRQPKPLGERYFLERLGAFNRVGNAMLPLRLLGRLKRAETLTHEPVNSSEKREVKPQRWNGREMKKPGSTAPAMRGRLHRYAEREEPPNS